MAKKLTNEQKREWAQMLFTKERLSQKEIAERVGVTEKTISNWKQKYEWDALGQSINVTKEVQLKRMYAQLDRLTQAIEDKEENKYPDIKEINTMTQLTNNIQKLETETSVAEIIDVGMKFVNFIRKDDWAMAQSITKLLDAFIQDTMS